MRIAELTTYTSRLNGGVFSALTQLLPRVARTAAADVRVFGFADPRTEDDRAAWAPLVVEAFPPWPPRYFGYSPRFVPALDAFAPQVVHAHGLWTYVSLASLRLHRRRRVPLVVSPHGMLDAWALAFSRTRKRIASWWFQTRQLRVASVLHALTAAEAQAIRAQGLTNPIVVVPNGVELPSAAAAGASPPWDDDVAWRARRTMLFLGRVHPKKGLALLLAAWREAAQTVSAANDWQLVVAGWDEVGHVAELQRQVVATGLDDRVRFVGPLFGDAKAAALHAADVCVLPSLSEGLPVSVLEAWAHSKPMLMTTACGLPEGAAAGAAWEVVPEIAALAEGLRRVFASTPEERVAMGTAGRRLVEAKFTWERVTHDMVRIYRAAAERTPMPADLVWAA